MYKYTGNVYQIHSRNIKIWDIYIVPKDVTNGSAASEALLRRLYDHSTQNLALQYHHQWRTGDFVIWDDRALLHAATADYAENEKRLLYRTMLKGGPTH